MSLLHNFRRVDLRRLPLPCQLQYLLIFIVSEPLTALCYHVSILDKTKRLGTTTCVADLPRSFDPAPQDFTTKDLTTENKASNPNDVATESTPTTSPAEMRRQADKLVAEGKKAIALKQWDEGVEKYADALDLM